MTSDLEGPLARPTVALWGFMGVGKSAIGRALAARCGATFVDLDLAIEEAEGRSVRAIFAVDGEARFRQLEGRLLDELLDDEQDRPRVVALGGGALLDPTRRDRALERWLVIALECRPETIVARTRGSSRPLLAAAKSDEERAGIVADLLKRRSDAYRSAHLTTTSEDGALGHLVEELARRWKGWA